MPVNVLFPVGLTGIMARVPLSWIMPAGILRQANLLKNGSPVVHFARMTSAFAPKRVSVYMRVTVLFRMCALLFLAACRSPLPDISAGPLFPVRLLSVRIRIIRYAMKFSVRSRRGYLGSLSE